MADHVGVYAISGAFMPNPATLVAKTATPTGVLVDRYSPSTQNAAGSVVAMSQIPSLASLVGSGTEVVNMNAMRSGSLVLESSSAGTVEIPSYYSKVSRLVHETFLHPASLADVFDNIPLTSPSGSMSGSTHVFNKYIGSLGNVIIVGDILPAPIDVVLDNSGDQDAIISATFGNIINVVSGAYSASIAVYSSSIVSPTTVRLYPAYSSPRNPPENGNWTSGAIYIHSWIPLSSSVSGVYVNSTFYDPVDVSIDVSSSGRIRDIRTWVEFIHDFRSVEQFGAYTGSGPLKNSWGLQSLQIALRSPNTNFKSAHPILNAPGVDTLPIRSNASLTGTSNRFGNTYSQIPELLRNSYLLWAGRAVDEGPGDVLGDTTQNYHEFDFDIDMRTVFWDGSSFKNPRDISYLHPSAGTTRSWIEITTPAITGSTEYQSPSSYAYKQALTSLSGQLYVDITVSGVLTGSDTPWIVDSRVDDGNIVKSGAFYNRASQTVPPDGWLTLQDASVKGWQSSFISSSIPHLFRSGRMAVRSSTKQVYLFGGEGVNGGADTSCSSYVAAVPYYFDTSVEQVSIQSGTILQNSFLPAPRSKMGVAYYTSSVGEHVLLVGGATASGDTTGSLSVFFGTFAGNDIVWETASSYQLPNGFPMVDCFGHTEHMSNVVHVVGGYSSGVFNPNIWGLYYDPATGIPTGSWTILGPSCTLQPITSAWPTHDPETNEHVLIIGYSGSQEIAQIVQLSGVFQLAFTINPDAPVPTGTDRYPLALAHGHLEHVYAIANSSGTIGATYAGELADDGVPFLIHSGAFISIGDPVPTSGDATSGTVAVDERVMFVGCGASSSPFSPQIFASTVVVAAASGGEFPTKGLQVGPSSMRPVYPLLDDVYSLKIYDQPPTPLSYNHGDIRGFRPGLRGTEVSGAWNVMFGMAAEPFDPVSGSLVEQSVGIWLRQIRLEMVVDRGIGSSWFYPSRDALWSRPSIVPGLDGFQGVAVLSGSTAWDIGLNQTQVSQSENYGRSVGITAATASSPASFAVQTFITGNLFTHLSESGVAPSSNPSWFLSGNGFGTPFIPDSSMSLGTGTAEEVDASASQEFYRRTIGASTLIPNANTMTDYLKRVNYSQTTQQVAETTQAELLSGSTDYFGF